METGSATSKSHGHGVSPKGPRVFNGPLFIFLATLSLHLAGVVSAHADQQIASIKAALAQDAASEPRVNRASSLVEKTGESLSAHSRNEVRCLALNIYFEARSEPEKGQRAVAHVVMNRVAHPRYPGSACEVVQQGGERIRHRCQFSWWCDGLSDKPVNKQAWNKSLRLAQEVYFGLLEDTTDGALWYHAVYVKPYWSEILLQGAKIGQHIFYLENQPPRKTM